MRCVLLFLFLNLFSRVIFSQEEKREELDALLRQLKKDKGEDVASLNSKISLIYLDYLNAPDSARIFAQKANDVAVKKGNKYIVAESYATMGRILLNESKPDSAQFLFFRALMALNSAPKNSLGKYDRIDIDFSDYKTCELAAHIYANFGNAYRQKMNLSKAVDFYLRALRAYEIAHDSTVIRFVDGMNKKGEKITRENLSIKIAQDYMKRHPEDKEAQEAGEAGAKMLAGLRWTCLDLGELFEKTKDYNQALIYLKRAEENAEAVEAKQSHLKILGSIGAVFQKRKDYDSAVIYFTKLCKRSEELKIIQGIIEGETKIGLCYRETGNYEKALQAYEKVQNALRPLSDGSYKKNEMYSYLPERLVEGKVFHFRSAINNLLLGDLNVKAGNANKAADYYKESLKLIEEVWAFQKNNNDTLTMINVLWTRGKLNSRLNDHQKAARDFNEAEKSSVKYLNIEDQILFFNDARTAFEKMGDDKNAYRLYKKYIISKDSVYNQSVSNEIADYQKRFEVEKKDASIELLEKSQQAQEAEIEKQKLVRNGFIIGSALFLLLTVIIFRSLQQNRKAKKIIEQQKEEVEHKNKEILDSITYAKRIQTALMPRKEYFDKNIGRLNKN